MSITAMKQTLAFLQRVTHWEEGTPDLHDVKAALRTAIAEAEKQEPIGYASPDNFMALTKTKLYSDYVPVYREAGAQPAAPMRAAIIAKAAGNTIDSLIAELNDERMRCTQVDHAVEQMAAELARIKGQEPVSLLEAFDRYARQFTFRNHAAKPDHFPKSFPWFEAGFLAAGAQPAPKQEPVATGGNDVPETHCGNMAPQYDPDLGQFLRTFNIRYFHEGELYELPIKASSWAKAEAMLKSIKANGIVFSELLEVVQ